MNGTANIEIGPWRLIARSHKLVFRGKRSEIEGLFEEMVFEMTSKGRDICVEGRKGNKGKCGSSLVQRF